MEDRWTYYDEDYGCFFLKQEYQPEDIHDLVNRIGALEDVLKHVTIKSWKIESELKEIRSKIGAL